MIKTKILEMQFAVNDFTTQAFYKSTKCKKRN